MFRHIWPPSRSAFFIIATVLFAAAALYGAAHPSSAPLRQALTQRYFETQGRADWQIEQQRKDKEAREAKERQQPIDDETRARQAKIDADRARQRQIEEALRQKAIDDEARRQADNDRLRQQYTDGIEALVAQADATAARELNILGEQQKVFVAYLPQMIRQGYSYEAIKKEATCTNLWSRTPEEQALCGMSILDAPDSRYSPRAKTLTTLAMLINAKPNYKVEMPFSLVAALHALTLKAARDGQLPRAATLELRHVLDGTPYTLKDIIRAQLTPEDEYVLLHTTAQSVARIYELKAARDALSR